jgi:HAD superfamily hydrolase (TIGR01484 family)
MPARRDEKARDAAPRPIAEIPADACRRLRWFFTDIDDTLTSGGMLPPSSYRALWELEKAGIQVVPVTGRPAGWCDHIARMWPVAGVVGENGAFWYSYDRENRRMTRRRSGGPEDSPRAATDAPAGRERLAEIAQRVLREVPGTGIAADQAFRVSDYAIDFREDVAPLGAGDIDAICRILEEEGVRYKVSSIHVNFWLGDFDKLSCLRGFVEEKSGSSFENQLDSMAFIGDSPNDEPLFAGIPLSIAVGNLREHLERISHLPRYITTAECAAGFSEAVSVILDKRGA